MNKVIIGLGLIAVFLYAAGSLGNYYDEKSIKAAEKENHCEDSSVYKIIRVVNGDNLVYCSDKSVEWYE